MGQLKLCSQSSFPAAAHTVPVDTVEQLLADFAQFAQPWMAVEEIERAAHWTGKLVVSTSEAPLKCTAQSWADCFVVAAELNLAAVLTKVAIPAIRLVGSSRREQSRMDSESQHKSMV